MLTLKIPWISEVFIQARNSMTLAMYPWLYMQGSNFFLNNSDWKIRFIWLTVMVLGASPVISVSWGKGTAAHHERMNYLTSFYMHVLYLAPNMWFAPGPGFLSFSYLPSFLLIHPLLFGSSINIGFTHIFDNIFYCTAYIKCTFYCY